MKDENQADVAEETEDADTLTDLMPITDPRVAAQEAVQAALETMTEDGLPGQVLAILVAPFPGGSPDEAPSDVLPYHTSAAEAVGKQLQYICSQYHGQSAWYVLLTDPIELDENVTTAILAKRLPIPVAVKL